MAVKHLPIGRIEFNIPPTLKLGETATIHLVLSLRETHEQLKGRISEIGETAGGELRVSDDMEAKLFSAQFEIKPLGDERKPVSAEDTTEWFWQMKPIETGVLELRITLSAFVRVAGQEKKREIKVCKARDPRHLTGQGQRLRRRELAMVVGVRPPRRDRPEPLERCPRAMRILAVRRCCVTRQREIVVSRASADGPPFRRSPQSEKPARTRRPLACCELRARRGGGPSSRLRSSRLRPPQGDRPARQRSSHHIARNPPIRPPPAGP